MSTLLDNGVVVIDDSAMHAVEVSVITLTLLNGVAAGLVLVLALVENYRQRRGFLNIAHERCTPLYLAVAILFSTAVFAVREFMEAGSGIPFITTDSISPSASCIALHQTSWWGK